MQLGTRKILDKSFSGLGVFSILLVTGALLVFLTPIAIRGVQAFVFRATVEYREMMLEKYSRGNEERIRAEVAEVEEVRRSVYERFDNIAKEADELLQGRQKRDLGRIVDALEDNIRAVLGPRPGDSVPALPRRQYGQTRWDRTVVKAKYVTHAETYDNSNRNRMGVKVFVPIEDQFKGTPLYEDVKALAAYFDGNLEEMMHPRWKFYPRFLTDKSMDSHFFGGIWPELLGTFYLTFGAMLFAIPMGVIAAIYLVEYAGEGRLISLLRTCISTLAGVPSIVFGLFGLAFFINTVRVSPSKSVLAGSLTLALLVLPIIIRASEEAILAVPRTYKEAALSLGASKWRTIVTVMLPASLPGILTGIVISMGRAAGETAPIIFTAAVSVGPALAITETLNNPTPALPWNIYNLATEHAEVEEIRHVQYGMVLVLVSLVLLLNVAAIVLRARIAKKLRG